MACRGFVLTNYQPELEEYFEIGTHLETFTSIEEMNDKISYYLKNDSKRETIFSFKFSKKLLKSIFIVPGFPYLLF